MRLSLPSVTRLLSPVLPLYVICGFLVRFDLLGQRIGDLCVPAPHDRSRVRPALIAYRLIMPDMNPIVLVRNRASTRTRLFSFSVSVHHMQPSLSCNPLVRAAPLAIANVNLAEAQPKSMLHGTDQLHMTRT